ncbi:MAG: ABC transporter ATP-binding protein/permease [Methylacidiphilales bacterium]|nr:ABC transporter ATP-binding protein/permease [Candidatus Methylacidiphilales bacterium]
MSDIYRILRFGWPYLRRYWLRFTLGIVFGFFFGLSNGLTMGGVYLMLNRLGDSAHVADETQQAKKAAAEKEEAQESQAAKSFHAVMKEVGAEIDVLVDPWLPLAHRALNWKQILGGLFLFPILALFRGLMNYSTTYLMAWAGQRISNDVKEDVFRKIHTLSLDFFHKHTSAELMSRINDDTGALNSCLRLGLSDLIKEPSTIISLFCGLLLIDWKLTVIALAFGPLCLIPTRIISRKIKSRGRQDNIAYVRQAGIALESFQNVRVTKAYDLSEQQAGLFRQSGNRASHFVLKTVQARAVLNPSIETLNSFGFGAVLLYAIYANVNVGTLGSFLVALVLFFTPFKKLSTVQVYFTQAGLAIERLMTLFEIQPTVREAAHPVSMAGFTRSIEFQNVSFSYGDGPILDHVSFTLPRGGRLGLAGESGSGKSSLINLLFRFYDPTSGHIEIDGVSIDTLRLADLRFHLALVSQDILLFNTTVAENIAFGKNGATREEIITAAREAHAHDFIEALPNGYDTPLGERGLRLSGGQRQRIAIARAFIRNAPILVLDEATASLDSQSEAEVQKAIDHLAENRTVVCVAHRLSTLRAMDQIIVLQKGRITEQGGFDELLARGGIFTAMAARQSIFPQPQPV